MKLRQLTLALSLVGASSVGLVGCGGGSNSYDEITNATLSGTAVKGVLSSATVVACLASSTACTGASVDDVGDSAGFLGQDFTDSDGGYSINLGSSANGLPVLVRIFGTSETTHTCDFTACVDDDLNNVNGLELSTVSFVDPPSGGGDVGVTANISALTTIAADSFLDTFAVDEVSTANEFFAAQQSISNSVASLLGLDITVDETALNLFDLDIPSATETDLNNATDQVVGEVTVPAALIQQLSVVNASFGGVVDADTSIADAIADAAGDVSTVISSVADDADPSGDTVTSLEALLTAMNTEVTAIADDIDGVEPPDITEPGDLEDIIDDLEVDTDLSDGGDDGTEPSGATGISGGSGD